MEQVNNPFGGPAPNPFEAPAPAPEPGGNPFDAFAAPQPQQQGHVSNQQPGVDPFRYQVAATPYQTPHIQQEHQLQQPQQHSYQSYPAAIPQQNAMPMSQQPANPYSNVTAAASADPFGQASLPSTQQVTNPYSNMTVAAPVTQVAANPYSNMATPVSADPFGQALVPSTQQAVNPYSNMAAPASADPFGHALVPSTQQPANPYSNMAAPTTTDPFGQALVPSTQQTTPWSIQSKSQASAVSLFDPYAVTPAPPPVAPPPPPVEDPFPAFSFDPQQQQSLVPVSAPVPSPYAMAPEPAFAQSQIQPYDTAAESTYNKDPRLHGDLAGNAMVAYQQPANEIVPYQAEPAQELPPHVNKYSQVLAAVAPPDAAPLPQGDKVIKSGYVLSRISFRTIMLKKWKQTYWVQYGPHTMVWFRNYADFDDWLNNPYLTQQQRNYLIKLAVNFVHDLYKPNVRGYQVTQARSKQYGNKILKQFKLERWMDFGPTIAAAFASTDPKEVDELRLALVECMRNTPIGDGIRATGAVRQPSPEDNGERRTRSASFGEGEFPSITGKTASTHDLFVHRNCLRSQLTLASLHQSEIIKLQVLPMFPLETSWTISDILILRAYLPLRTTILYRVFRKTRHNNNHISNSSSLINSNPISISLVQYK